MLYEIITLNGGNEFVAYSTTSRRDIREKFAMCADSRLRVNGRILTIAEAEELRGSKKRPVVINNGKARSLVKVDEAGNVLARYRTVKDAATMNGLSPRSVITAYTTGRAVKGMYFREISNA